MSSLTSQELRQKIINAANNADEDELVKIHKILWPNEEIEEYGDSYHWGYTLTPKK